MTHPEEPTLPEDTGQRKNKNMEDIYMRTIVRSTALTLVAFALALILPNTASAACEGFADVPEDAACYESVMYLAEHGITKGTEANTFSPAQPVTVRQWAVLLCRAYGMETSGETWADLGRSATEQACQKSWLNMTALSTTDTRMCRGALYESALVAAGVSVYDSVLYEGVTNLSAYDNYLHVGCELQLCPADAMASEIVTRGEAAQLLHAILTQNFTVEAPPSPVTLENPTGVHANDFLLELRRVPEPILVAFNEAGWTYRIDFDFMADLSDRLDMSCIGATSYGKKIIYVSDAKATIHEFGHFLDGALGFPAEHERLYLAEAQDSGLRDYAKTNSREYFADCFVYWITYSGNEKRMETFRNAALKTYAYMEKLSANSWAF